MFRFAIAFALLVCCAAVAPPASAQTKSAREVWAAQHKQNFAGWKGIVFFCAPETPGITALRDICTRAATDAAFLAATAKVKLVVASHYNEFVMHQYEDDALGLELVVLSTSSGSPSAIYAVLRAGVGYSNAVEKAPSEERRKSARGLPRRGDLILWERGVTGVTTGDHAELVSGVGTNVETVLKQFFADFLTARQ